MNASNVERETILGCLAIIARFIRKHIRQSTILDYIQGIIVQAADAAVGLHQPNYDDVIEFHAKFNVGPPGSFPEFPAEDVWAFRKKFFEEELYEMDEAYRNGDLVKFFDAHLDLAYITFGSAHLANLPWQLGWQLVHQANMDKERAASAEASLTATGRGHKLDVIKPDGWLPPEPAIRELILSKQAGDDDETAYQKAYAIPHGISSGA